ncbi:MAG TPA: 50S ribosomal protein L18 [Vicinamibacterales bacterium]|jgi:large subunit ribosomal protein L18|nr:50S ribosomal protein L18 [Vicinamibacterales bacterium]
MRIKTREDRRQRIKFRIRKRVAGDQDRPRLTVFRSLSHIYVQVIDDMTGKTVVSAGTNEPALKKDLSGKIRGGNVAGAQFIGKTIAQRLIEKGIKKVVFDRNGYLYHGRIRAVADAAREAGLEF